MKKFLILFPENWTYDTLQNFRDAFYPKLESNEHFKNSVSVALERGNYKFVIPIPSRQLHVQG